MAGSGSGAMVASSEVESASEVLQNWRSEVGASSEVRCELDLEAEGSERSEVSEVLAREANLAMEEVRVLASSEAVGSLGTT